MSHSHAVPNELSRSFLYAIILNVIFVTIEISIAFRIWSLALLSDGTHNLTDLFGLVIGLIGVVFAQKKATKYFTYGFGRVGILAALLNCLLLFGMAGIIAVQAFHRLGNPPEIFGLPIILTAGVGILVNGFSAYLFHRAHSHDINIRGTYLHLLADAGVSLSVVISGVLIQSFGWTLADPIMSLIVVVVILWSGGQLLMESIRLILDGVNPRIDLISLQRDLSMISGIQKTHHLHIWNLATDRTAATLHIILSHKYAKEESRIKRDIREIFERYDITHATIEVDHETDWNIPHEHSHDGHHHSHGDHQH